MSPLGSGAEGRGAAKLIHLAVVSFLFLNELTAFRAPESKSLPRAEQVGGPQPPGRQQPPLPRTRGDAPSRSPRPAEVCRVLLCKRVPRREHRTAELISVLNFPLKFIFSKLFTKSAAQLFHINLFLLANFSSARGSFTPVSFLFFLLQSRV